MYINTISYISRMDEICMHTAGSNGTSQQNLVVQFRRDHAQTTIIYISFSYYHVVKLVLLKYESEGCPLSRTNLLALLAFSVNGTAISYMHDILLCTTCKQIILL